MYKNINKSEVNRVQAFITNMTTPTSLDELRYTFFECGDIPILPDKLLYAEKGEPTQWTAPRWAKIGDVVFFMFAKSSARSNLTRIRTELKHVQDIIPEPERIWLQFWINHGLALHDIYGGCIFAIARVTGRPFAETHEDDLMHWGSTIYADMYDVVLLEHPVHISEFRDFVTVSRQSSITPVLGDAFMRMMNLLTVKNNLPKAYLHLEPETFCLKDVDKNNWLDMLRQHGHALFLEAQFRRYCVDYFLREFGDKTSFYSEARCVKRNDSFGFVDNLVMYHGKWLSVEVKLNIHIEHDLEAQLQKYMNVDFIEVKNQRILSQLIWQDKVLVVDVDGIYLYDGVLHDVLKWSDVSSIGMRDWNVLISI